LASPVPSFDPQQDIYSCLLLLSPEFLIGVPLQLAPEEPGGMAGWGL